MTHHEAAELIFYLCLAIWALAALLFAAPAIISFIAFILARRGE